MRRRNGIARPCAAAMVGLAWSAVVPAAGPAQMILVAGNGTAGFADGRGSEARFNKPIRLAPFDDDSVLVADIFNHALRVVSKDGTVRTLAGSPDRKGSADGAVATASFTSPHGVGTSADGRIAVAEAGTHTLRLLTRDANAAGGYTVTTLAGVAGEKGRRDGPAGQSLLNSPHAAIWAGDGSVYVPDIGNAAIRRVAKGVVETVAGGEGVFVYPMDIAWMKDGRLVVADAGSNLLRVVDAGGRVTTLATKAPLSTPHGVTVDQDGTVYVADMGSHRVLAIDADGAVTTLVGEAGTAGDDAGHLRKPAAVLAHSGWLWIADLDNHRICAVPLPR